MVIQDVEERFLKYVSSITTKFLDDNSLIDDQYEVIEKAMISYGLDNPQKSKILSELTQVIIGSTGREISSSALALIKLEEEALLNDINLKIKEEDLKIRKIDLEIAKIKLEQAELEKEKTKCEAELVCNQAKTEVAKKANVEASTLLVNNQAMTEIAKKANVEAGTFLTNAQTTTEAQKTKQVIQQTALVLRQKQGYGDNLLIKAAEYRGGLASFAMNSAPENPTTGDIVTKFNSTVNSLEGRSGW